MSRRMLALAMLLFLCGTAPLFAQPAAGGATWRVTIVLYLGDDPAAVAKRFAAMYRGTLETPVDGNGSFTISLPGSGAGLMRRDPVVAAMDTLSPAAPAGANAVSATAALPASQRPVGTNATTGWTLGPYQYDGSGNIRKVGSDFYVYDKPGRIVVSADAQPSVVHEQTYTYDPYGNLRTIHTAGRGTATLNISGITNRLSSASDGATSAPVSYDGAGNFVSYLGATYEYDALNVMRKSVAGGVTRSYVYTANDERIGTIRSDLGKRGPRQAAELEPVRVRNEQPGQVQLLFELGTDFLTDGSPSGSSADLPEDPAQRAAYLQRSGGTVTRYMTEGEARIARETGNIPNVGRDGKLRPTHVTTDKPTNNATTAQKRYEIDKPTQRATVPTDRVPGGLGPTPDGRPTTSGGGSQAATNRPIPVRPSEIRSLDQSVWRKIVSWFL